MGKGVLTNEEKQWAYDRWCEGRTLIEIADALHVCMMTVRRALKGKPRIRPILEYSKGGDRK